MLFRSICAATLVIGLGGLVIGGNRGNYAGYHCSTGSFGGTETTASVSSKTALGLTGVNRGANLE